MAISFLMRFQEAVAASAEPDVSCGTKTVTESRESSDQDPSVPSLGTKTSTATREQSDSDPGVMTATQTVTMIRTEQADSDPGKSPMSYRTLPLSPMAGTSTHTKVNREDRDQDQSRIDCGTSTLTRTAREDADQDVASAGRFAAIPVTLR